MYIHYVLLSFCSSGPTEDRILSPGWYVCNWKREGGRKNTWKREREKDKGEGVTNKIIFCFMSIADNNYNLIPRLSCHSTGAGARYPA